MENKEEEEEEESTATVIHVDYLTEEEAVATTTAESITRTTNKSIQLLTASAITTKHIHWFITWYITTVIRLK